MGSPDSYVFGDMVRLIINILILIVLAVFVALNMPYKTGLNIFGWQLEEVSVVAVVLVSLVAGVLYSFGFYVMNYMTKVKRSKLKEKSKTTREKEKELKAKEKDLEKIEDVISDENVSEKKRK